MFWRDRREGVNAQHCSKTTTVPLSRRSINRGIPLLDQGHGILALVCRWLRVSRGMGYCNTLRTTFNVVF